MLSDGSHQEGLYHLSLCGILQKAKSQGQKTDQRFQRLGMEELTIKEDKGIFWGNGTVL